MLVNSGTKTRLLLGLWSGGKQIRMETPSTAMTGYKAGREAYVLDVHIPSTNGYFMSRSVDLRKLESVHGLV